MCCCYRFDGKADSFDVVEDLEVVDPEADSAHFIAILVKCLALLEKLPLVLNVINAFISSIHECILSIISGDTI